VWTLTQGYLLNGKTLGELVESVPGFLLHAEGMVAQKRSEQASNPQDQETAASGAEGSASFARRRRAAGGSKSPIERDLEAGMFALQFLPWQAAPSLIVLTDGVFDPTGRGSVLADFDDVFMRLSRHDVTASIVCLCPFWRPSTALGYIADVEAARMAVECTGGTVLPLADVTSDLGRLVRAWWPCSTGPAPLRVRMQLCLWSGVIEMPARRPLPTTAHPPSPPLPLSPRPRCPSHL
jgi:hypothetical protein